MLPAGTVVHHPHRQKASTGRTILIGLAGILALVFLGIPIAVVFAQAFAKGIGHWWQAITQPETLHAIGLSLLSMAIVVPINVLYGLAVAWAVGKFRFPGRKILISIIEMPFSVSPIVAGVALLLVFGGTGWLGPWLEEHNLKIMFAVPGIVLAMLFVTSPFIARELLPLIETHGNDAEEAALILVASGWRTFLSITLPQIKWALFYGVVLCAARCLGEFGAVSIVSGQIRGETNTLPLQIDLLYHDYDTAGAFAAASALTLLALITMLLKIVIERRFDQERQQNAARE